MSVGKYLDVFEQDGWLCITVEMHHPDGSFWHVENFRWQGREGLKHKRQTNSEGYALMDNGVPAPTREGPGDNPQPYLPGGRTYLRQATSHLAEDSLSATIKAIHAQRLVTGWPQGPSRSIPRSFKLVESRDKDGVAQLMTKFTYLKGLPV